MEFLNFEPSDFQILEDIEFDETIQRPEKVRFYTLEEQEVDAYEKMVPKGRVTQFQRDQTKKKSHGFVICMKPMSFPRQKIISYENLSLVVLFHGCILCTQHRNTNPLIS